MKKIVLIFLALTLTLCAVEPIDIGSRRELFIDGQLIAPTISETPSPAKCSGINPPTFRLIQANPCGFASC